MRVPPLCAHDLKNVFCSAMLSESKEWVVETGNSVKHSGLHHYKTEYTKVFRCTIT